MADPASTATKQELRAAETAAEAAAPVVPTELKSESWPYPLKLPAFPLDFTLLRHPKLSIFHDACGHPLVRYYWPASTATAAASSTQKEPSTHSATRPRGVVVLVHDEGTHTVFDWLKNASLQTQGADVDTGPVAHLASVLTPEGPSVVTSEHRAAPPPLDLELSCCEFKLDTTADLQGAAAGVAASATASEGETPSPRLTAAAHGAEAALKDATTASAAAAGVASFLSAPPLFRDLPQKPLHAARTACYEGSWVELFNAAGLDVHAVDLLQHGLSALVERQQQRQRRRKWKHERKSREASASGEDNNKEVEEEEEKSTLVPFDLLAEDLCCLLEEVCRLSTLPIFLIGQGTGATAAARAAELLAKKGKLGKPHVLRAASTTTSQDIIDAPTGEQALRMDSITAGYEGVGASPVLSGVRHIGKETVLPVPYIAVQARPIPLAGLVLLSPVLQLRESLTVERMATTTNAVARGEGMRHRKHKDQHQKTDRDGAKGRRWSDRSYNSAIGSTTIAEEEIGYVRAQKGAGNLWNLLSWLGGRPADIGPPVPVQYGVRLRRRRHAREHVLLPPLDLDEVGELPGEKRFNALYEKLYFRDRLTIKTMFPCAQLAELRKGVNHTLSDARWLLIPIERDSRQLVSVATWQEQYQKWKETIAERVKEQLSVRGQADERLLQQQRLLSLYSKDPTASVELSVDLSPWLRLETPTSAAAAALAADPPTVAVSADSRRAEAPGGDGAMQLQRDEEDEVQQEANATEAESVRRKQLNRMQMAFYLKVLVVQAMTAPQQLVRAACTCGYDTEALPADSEVECLADAPDVQGVVSFYQSLGGKGSVARHILVQHKQLPAGVLKKKKEDSGTWLTKCCKTAGDDDALAAADLAAAAAAEAAQTGTLALLDVSSEEARMGDECEWEEEDVTSESTAEDGDEGSWPVFGALEAARELDGTYGRELEAHDATFLPYGVMTETTQRLPSTLSHSTGRTPSPRLPAATAERGGGPAAAAETQKDIDSSSDAMIEARYAALQEERKRLDEDLQLVDADVGISTRTPAGRAAAEVSQLGSKLPHHSTIYKRMHDKDFVRFGTVVGVPYRWMPTGESIMASDGFCRNLLLKQCGGLFGKRKPGVWGTAATAQAFLDAETLAMQGHCIERLRWVKEYPVSCNYYSRGLLPMCVFLKAPCQAAARVRVVEELDAPVHVVEKIIMHEASADLKATMKEIEEREQQEKKRAPVPPCLTCETGNTGAPQAQEAPAEFQGTPVVPITIPKKGGGKRRKLIPPDVRYWRRVGGIVVDGKGRQVPLEHVEKLRMQHPREYVNLFLYGAASEAAAELAGAAVTEGMQHRSVTLWLLPEVHHAALCQADEGNQLGRELLNKWLLPALQDLQRSEALWQGSQVRSQLRKQLSSQILQDSRSP